MNSCTSSSGEASPIIPVEQRSERVSDSTTVIDLNSGQRVKINVNPLNDITTNDVTGEIVRIYVNPITKDTFDGLNGRKVNHAIVKTNLGTYGIDMKKVKLEEKAVPSNSNAKSPEL